MVEENENVSLVVSVGEVGGSNNPGTSSDVDRHGEELNLRGSVGSERFDDCTAKTSVRKSDP